MRRFTGDRGDLTGIPHRFSLDGIVPLVAVQSPRRTKPLPEEGNIPRDETTRSSGTFPCETRAFPREALGGFQCQPPDAIEPRATSPRLQARPRTRARTPQTPQASHSETDPGLGCSGRHDRPNNGPQRTANDSTSPRPAKLV